MKTKMTMKERIDAVSMTEAEAIKIIEKSKAVIKDILGEE